MAVNDGQLNLIYTFLSQLIIQHNLQQAKFVVYYVQTEFLLQILAHESFAQLRQIFEEYKAISGRTIEQAIKAEIDGELKDGLSAIGILFVKLIGSQSGISTYNYGDLELRLSYGFTDQENIYVYI